MSRILVTGMSGTGKSSVLAALGRHGYRVVDTDDPGWREYRENPAPPDELHLGEWHWVEERMESLLDSDDGRPLFVAGCTSNQSKFANRFNAVVLLSAPPDVLLDRVGRRTTNPYGKTRVERAMILDDLANIEPLLRASCTHELDANRPLDDVVADLIAIASDAIELRTDHLILRPMPPAAAALLPGDRAGAAELIGVAFDDEWPLPDILDLMPVHAGRSGSAARFSIWLIVEAATDTVVGDIGFFGPPSDAGEVEIGYSVVPSRRRRGYAGEALAALVAWAFDQPGVRTIVAGTDPDNDVSQRVLRRAGFERTTESATELRWRLVREAR